MFSWLEAGPYPCRIALCTNEDMLTAFLKEEDLPPSKLPYPSGTGAMAYWWTKPGMEKTYIIAIDREDFKGASLSRLASVITHEAYHVTQWIWEDICQAVCNHEAETYFIQWLVQQVLDMLGYGEKHEGS